MGADDHWISSFLKMDWHETYPLFIYNSFILSQNMTQFIPWLCAIINDLLYVYSKYEIEELNVYEQVISLSDIVKLYFIRQSCLVYKSLSRNLYLLFIFLLCSRRYICWKFLKISNFFAKTFAVCVQIFTTRCETSEKYRYSERDIHYTRKRITIL